MRWNKETEKWEPYSDWERGYEAGAKDASMEDFKLEVKFPAPKKEKDTLDIIKNELKNWAKQYTDKEIPEDDLEKVAEMILGKLEK